MLVLALVAAFGLAGTGARRVMASGMGHAGIRLKDWTEALVRMEP